MTDKPASPGIISPMRVISLLPSATELLCAIPGGASMLVGRSHECDFPANITHLPVLTGQRTQPTTSAEIDRQVRESLGCNESLYTLDREMLSGLRPDVILTQDLCDVCSIDLSSVRRIAAEMHPSPTIVSLNPATLEGVFDDLGSVGEAVGLRRESREVMITLRDRYEHARDHVNPYAHGPEVAFLEWMEPVFVGGHWTPQLIEKAGGRHSLNRAGEKSRQVDADQLVASQPERLIICPCGYGLDQIHRELSTLIHMPWWNDLPAVRHGNVVMVDGNQMFNRPGPRLVDAFCWLVGWINDIPSLIPDGFPVEPVSDSPPSLQPHSQESHR